MILPGTGNLKKLKELHHHSKQTNQHELNVVFHESPPRFNHLLVYSFYFEFQEFSVDFFEKSAIANQLFNT